MKKIFVLLSVLALSACGSSYPYQTKQVKVDVSEYTHSVHFAKGSAKLGLSEKRKLMEIPQDIRVDAVQSVEIETHGDDGLSHSRAHRIKDEMIKLGFPIPTFRHEYVNTTRQDVEVHVLYAVAIPPAGCPDWASRAAPNFSNQIHSNFNCATRTNIARQAANPMDLVHGNNVVHNDGDRTQAIMAPYKANTVITNSTDSATGN